MLPRFHLSDLSTVGHHIGTLLVLTGILMLMPLAVALLFGEYASAIDFVFGIGCCLFAGASLRLLKAWRVDRRCSLLLTGFAWIIVGLMAAIPMFLSGSYASYIDALFDSVSALTTTGKSLAADLDALSYSQIVWHAVLTLAGGQAVIIIAVYMGFFGEGSFAAVATTRGYSDLVSSEFAKSTRLLWTISAAFAGIGTLVAFCIGLFIGLSPAEALVDGFCLAANAANTGGFVPHASSLIYYHCWGVDAFALVLFLLGATNVGVVSLAMKGRFAALRKNSEFRLYVGWTVAFVTFVAFGMAHDAIYQSLGGLVDRGMFMALSSLTTAGMQTMYPEQLATCLSDGVLILLMLATFLGASACSTSGGVKLLRVMEVLRWFGYTIFRAILPDNARVPIRYNYFGTRNMTPVDATRAMTIMILYLAFAALGAMAFIAHGNNALTSVFESISYVCNSGVGVGIMSPQTPVDLKLIAIAQMWAGRVEFIALIAALAGIVISLRPMHPSAGGGRAGRKALTPWQRLQQSRRTRRNGGFARAAALGIAIAAAVAAAMLPLAAAAAPAPAADQAQRGGAGVSASQIDSLKSEAVESYREMNVSDLLGASERLDGRRVEITATAYGGPIRGEDGSVWINVKQGSSMIGVNLTSTQASKVTGYGNYWQTGDSVTVRGVFHRTCGKHHGELDLHGVKVSVIAQSQPIAHPANLPLLAGGLGFASLGLVAMFVKRLVYGRTRRKRKLLGLV